MSVYYIQALQTQLQDAQVKQLLISDPYSLAYLLDNYTVDPGERFYALLVSPHSATLYLNALFTPFDKEAFDSVLDIVIYQDGQDVLSQVASQVKGDTLGIDKVLPSHFLIDLMALLPHVHFAHGSQLVDHMRGIKTEEEIQWMSQSSHINDMAMEKLIQLIPQRLSEAQMALELREIYHQLGADDFSFPPIIAYGAHGSDPHHLNTQSKVQVGDSIILDIGCMFNHYASDMTRTVFYKEVPPKAQEVYEIVKQAQEAAISLVKPGVSFKDIDAAARYFITQAGYGDAFIHRTGHFIGRQTHETGDVSQYNHDLLEVGQIFSIEPGIYLPGEFGVRIEDLVLVTESGYRLLNHYTKDLQIIG